MSVTFSVLKLLRSMAGNEKQSPNIPNMFVTFEVLKPLRLREVNDLH